MKMTKVFGICATCGKHAEASASEKDDALLLLVHNHNCDGCVSPKFPEVSFSVFETTDLEPKKKARR